jgi:hypothetical protein
VAQSWAFVRGFADHFAVEPALLSFDIPDR